MQIKLSLQNTKSAFPWAVFWISSFVFLFLFRFGIALRLSGTFDERCYLSWAEKLVGANAIGCSGSSHPPGIAIVWLPAAFLGRILAAFFGESSENWIAALCGLQSLFLWMASLFLMREALQRKAGPQSDLISILLILSVPVLFFSATRTLLVHSAEFFLGTLVLYCLFKGWVIASVFSTVLLCTVRPSDFPYLFPLMIGLSEDKRTKKAFYFIVFFLIFFSLILGYIGFIKSYHSTHLPFLLKNFDWYNALLIFFRTDFGIVWTQPLLLAWILYIFKNKRGLDGQSQQAIAAIGILFFIALIWPTHGSSFGYRYLIGVYPLVFFTLLKMDFNFTRVLNSLSLRFLVLYQVVWLTLLYWVAPASANLWPWKDLNYRGLAPPYGVVFSWFQNLPEFLGLIQFTPFGYWLFKIQGKSVTFQLMGQQMDYGLSGYLGLVFHGFTLLFLMLFLLSSYFLIKTSCTFKRLLSKQ